MIKAKKRISHLQSSPKPLITRQLFKETTRGLFHQEPQPSHHCQHTHKYHSGGKDIANLDKLVSRVSPRRQVSTPTGVAAPQFFSSSSKMQGLNRMGVGSVNVKI